MSNKDDIYRNMDDGELEREIQRRRTEVGRDIDELGERLTPEHMKAEAREKFREVKERAKVRTKETVMSATNRAKDVTVQTGAQLGPAIRHNPLPLALIAGGLGWLVVDAYRRGNGRRWQPGTRELPGELYEEESVVGEHGGIKARFEDAQFSVRRRATAARSRMGHWRARGNERLRAGSDRMGSYYHDNPFAVAGVALALGFGIGAAFPPSRRERTLLGEAGRRLEEKASEIAREAKRAGEEAGRAAFEQVMPSEREEESGGEGRPIY